MTFNKLIFCAFIVVFCYFSLGQSVRCFSCDSKKSCKNAKSYECTSQMANYTRVYLSNYHKYVNLNQTSPYIECFHERLKKSSNEIYYSGCIYSTMRGCNMQLNDYYASYDRTCVQCDRDRCNNPANRASIHWITLPLLAFAGLLTRKCI